MPYNNPEKAKAHYQAHRKQRRAYYLKNREKINARSRAYYKAHPKQCKETRRKYVAAHRKELLEKQRQKRKEKREFQCVTNGSLIIAGFLSVPGIWTNGTPVEPTYACRI